MKVKKWKEKQPTKAFNWMSADDFSRIVFYSTLKDTSFLLYLDLYREEPLSYLYIKFKTDLANKGAVSIPLFLLEERGIRKERLDIMQEYHVFYVPFAVVKIKTTEDGTKMPDVIKRQVLALFYSDLEDIFSHCCGEVDEVQNILYKPSSKQGRSNIKSIGRLVEDEFERVVNGLIRDRYDTEFYVSIFNSLIDMDSGFNSNEDEGDIEVEF